jgi:hypothetical protein
MKWKQMAVADRVREALLPSWFYLNLLASWRPRNCCYLSYIPVHAAITGIVVSWSYIPVIAASWIASNAFLVYPNLLLSSLPVSDANIGIHLLSRKLWLFSWSLRRVSPSFYCTLISVFLAALVMGPLVSRRKSDRSWGRRTTSDLPCNSRSKLLITVMGKVMAPRTALVTVTVNIKRSMLWSQSRL